MLGPAGLMSARDAAGATVPTAPSGLNVDQTSDTSTRVTWTDNSNNEDNFLLYRQKDGGGFSVHQTLAKDTEEYEDTGLTTGSTYDYKVSAKNEVGESTQIGPVSIEVTASVPDAPTNLSASPGSDDREIDLSWTDNASNEDEYLVYLAPGNDDYTLVATLSAGTTSHTETVGSENTEYNFKVAASNTAGEAFSSVVTQACRLDVPTNFDIAVLNVDSRTGDPITYRATWDDNTVWEDNYEILKNGSVFDTMPADTEQRDISASATTDGDVWKVRAIRSSLPDSDFSNTFTI